MILFGSLAFSGCTDSIESVIKKEKRKPPGPTLPVDWTLTDTQGRSIDATIIGRELNSVTIVRRSDGRRFDLPFDRLGQPDRERAARLPLKPAPSEPTGLLKLRKASLSELETEIQQLATELRESTSPMKSRSLASRLDRLANERAELIAEIAELERK